MLTRQGIAPLEHFAQRLDDVKRVSKLVGKWASVKSQNRRTSSFKRFKIPHKPAKAAAAAPGKRALRKSHKRVLEQVLPHSHTFLAKRMRMANASRKTAWFGLKTALSSNARCLESSLNLARNQCVLMDLSYEVWYSISSPNVTETLQRLFDPETTSFPTDLTATELMLHEVDSFPENALCPVRLRRMEEDENTVHLALHPFCAEAFEQSVARASGFENVAVKQIEGVSTFLLLGGALEPVFEYAASQVNVQREQAVQVLCCPITNRVMRSEEEFAKHFFSKQFGVQLQHQLISLSTTTPLVSGQSKTPSLPTCLAKLDFVLGRKKSSQLPASLLTCTTNAEDAGMAKRLFLLLAKRATACIGSEEYAHIATAARLPCFPQDYPDTLAYDAYWSMLAERETERWNALPRSKRGSRRQPQTRPVFAAAAAQEEEAAAAVVVRGWHYIKDFTESEEDVPIGPNLLLRVLVEAPRASRLGPKLCAPLTSIYLATDADYDAFCQAASKGGDGASSLMLSSNGEQRVLIGAISSARTTANECYGVGHVRAEAYMQLLQHASDARKMKRRSLFVLLKRENTAFGIGFLTLF